MRRSASRTRGCTSVPQAIGCSTLTQLPLRPHDAHSQRRADARGRSPHHRRHRHPVARADGERRPAGRGGDGGGVRRAGSRAASPCCAAAATTAATASSSRARCSSAASTPPVFVIGSVADVRGDARTNLDILGRLGVTVVEIGDEQTLGAALLGDSAVHADRRRDLRHRPQGGRSPACWRRSSPTSTRRAFPIVVDRSAERPVGRHAAPDRRLHRRVDDGHAGGAQAAAGPAAGRSPRRRRRHRRHRHPVRRDRGSTGRTSSC